MSRVLIIDDEEVVRYTLAQILQSQGWDVVEAQNGREGLQAYGGDVFDLVLTDIIMPEQEGIETIAELRRQDPYVPIIAISGGGRIKNMDFLAMAKRMGADATIKKPIDPKELLKTAEEFVRDRAK